MDEDRVEGKVKETAGKLTGDESKEAEGKLQSELRREEGRGARRLG